MTRWRRQGDPWQELCAVSEGFCPDCLTPLQALPAGIPDWCAACQRWWSVYHGTPSSGYSYHSVSAAEWYPVHE
jgi:hypothetical protein